MVETRYGGTVANVKRKRVPGGGSSYSKATRTEACTDTDRQLMQYHTHDNTKTVMTVLEFHTTAYLVNFFKQILSETLHDGIDEKA